MRAKPEQRPGLESTPAELAALRPLAVRLGATRRRATARLAGTSLAAVRGRGMEFAEVRAYAPGDEVRHIDWHVTARTGTPHSKLFEEERERPVFVVADMRKSMRFGTRQCFKSVAAARAAALRAWGAVARGDRVGGVTLSGVGLASHRLRRDRNGVTALIAALADATSSAAEAPADAVRLSLADALRETRRLAGHGTDVFLLSDFSDLDATSSRHLSALARSTRTHCVFVHDPLEAQVPARGRYRISNGEKVVAIGLESASSRAAWSEPFETRLRRLEELCRENRAHLELLSTASDALGFELIGRARLGRAS